MVNKLVVKKSSLFPIAILVSIPLIILCWSPVKILALDPYFIFSNIVIGLLAILMILVEGQMRPYSLHLMHWIFNYIFWFMAPLVQYLNGEFPWGLSSIGDYKYILSTNVVILLWDVIWIIGRYLKLSTRPIRHVLSLITSPIGRLGSELFYVIGPVAFFIWVSINGFSNIFIRGTLDNEAVEVGIESALALIIGRTVRALPVVLLAVIITQSNFCFKKSSLKSVIVLTLSSLMVLVSNFPSGSARYWAGAIYLGITLLLFGSHIKNGTIFAALFTGAFLIVFPALNSFRWATNFGDALHLLADFGLYTEAIRTPHFDAFAMISHTLKYVTNGPGVTMGRQLIGVLLFFIPRAFWPTKPIGSGWTVALYYHFFPNVSSPPQAEGLINFGYAGVVIISFIISIIFAYIDRAYWRCEYKKQTRWIDIIYPFWLGFSFFMMRGDLLSSYSYLLGFSAAFSPLLIRITLRRKRVENTCE